MIIGKIEKTQRQRIEIGRAVGLYAMPALNVFIIACINFTVSWETKSQASRNNDQHT